MKWKVILKRQKMSVLGFLLCSFNLGDVVCTERSSDVTKWISNMVTFSDFYAVQKWFYIRVRMIFHFWEVKNIFFFCVKYIWSRLLLLLMSSMEYPSFDIKSFNTVYCFSFPSFSLFLISICASGFHLIACRGNELTGWTDNFLFL